MTNAIQYITKGGERWDTIANYAYGSASMMNDIIAANPKVPIYDILPTGIVLNIPIINKVEVKTDAELLPPWKR